jgi:hypothetical protein
MSVRSAVELTLTVLFAVALACLWILPFEPIRQAWTRPASPPIERPTKIAALVTKLKTIRLLRELNSDPTSCGRVPKGRRRDRCFYRAGDMQVVVIWARQSVDPTSLVIVKTEPRGSVPFAWADLSDTIRLLCGIDAEGANAIAQESQVRLERTPWYRQGNRVTADTDGAWRGVSRAPDAACSFEIGETVTGSKVSARLGIKRVSAD